MKLGKALRIILALTIATLVLDEACLQNFSTYSAIEINVEEPADEDVADDLGDDKEHSASEINVNKHYPFIVHYTNYLLNHTHQVQEAVSPPPEV